MPAKLILNDVHLGVQRVAGTSAASQVTLRGYLQEQFNAILQDHTENDVIILGDLFDGFTIDVSELLQCYYALCGWMAQSHDTRTLYLVAGNHDIGKRNDRLSSFDLLASLLVDRYDHKVVVVNKELYSTPDNVHIIPHCMNQDLFNIELEKALHVEPGYLLLHANVDNGFAEESDHSLNVDAEWLYKLSKKHHLIFAHEHQHRSIAMDHGKHGITVLGNQWPSSIADCLAHGEAQKNGRKYAHLIGLDGSLKEIETWHRDGDFEQMDWTDLHETPARFIRITGEASAEQAADVISAIARYRQRSDAFVVGNGVKIAGAKGMDELAAVTFENVKAFDVLGALLETLDPAEAKVVKELLG